jgi:thermitase
MRKNFISWLLCMPLLIALPMLSGCSKGAIPASPLLPPSVQRQALSVGKIPGQIEIGLRSTIVSDPGEIEPGLRGAAVRSRNAAIRVMTVRVQPGTEAAVIAQLKKNPNVEFAAQDTYAHTLAIPNDPGYAQQYALPLTGWEAAYGVSPTLGGSSSTVIAIVDTGIQLDHPDLGAKVLPGTSFVAGTTTPYDDNGHGTHCAGIAAAITDNAVGIAGTNPLAQLLPVKVLDASGSGAFSDVANGITWAADHGANIISMSLGCPAPCSDPATSSAIAYAKNVKGVLVVVAAGNDAGAVSFPGSDRNAMAIAATDRSDAVAYFSNFGPEVSVAAPGVDIYSTYLPSTYALLSGTSMSTPMVSGLAGLLVKPGSTPSSIRARIENTADKVGPYAYVGGRNDHYGYGRINVYNAVVGGPAPTPTATPVPTPTPVGTPPPTPAPSPTPCDGDCP